MKLAVTLTLLILNTPALALDEGEGVLLYDPGVAIVPSAPPFEIDKKNAAILLDAPANVKAYCKPGTLGKLPNDNGEADPVSIEGRFTKKAAQWLTLLPICEHKLNEHYQNWVYGVVVTDVVKDGQPFKKPELVFYIAEKTGEPYAGPGQRPMRLNDFNGDGLSELGLKFGVGDTSISHQIQMFQLSPSPKYIVTFEQGRTNYENPLIDFDAAVYYVPTTPEATFIGAEFGSTFHTRVLFAGKQSMNIIVR